MRSHLTKGVLLAGARKANLPMDQAIKLELQDPQAAERAQRGLDRDRRLALQTIISVQLELGLHKDALAYAQRLLETSEKAPPSERADAYLLRARIELALKDEVGAEASLKLALETAPDHVTTLRELVSLKLASRKALEALTWAERLIETAEKAPPSERASAYRLRAQVQRELKDEAGAETSLELALMAAPDDAPTLQELASLKLASQRPEEALALVERLITAAKKAPASERADAYRQKAQIQRKLDDEAGAQASLKLALDREPGNARTLEELSSLGLAEQRQKAQAQRARDDKVGGQVSLKLAGGRPQEALALLDGHPPSDARLQAPWLVLRGLARMMLKERAVALEDLGAAIRLDPMAACFDKLLLNNRHRLAAPYFDLCVERFPKDPALRLDRGVARYLSGQTDGALEDFRKAVELKPDYPEAYLSMASALSASRRPAEALAAADKAVELAKGRSGPIREQSVALQSSLRKAVRKTPHPPY